MSGVKVLGSLLLALKRTFVFHKQMGGIYWPTWSLSAYQGLCFILLLLY